MAETDRTRYGFQRTTCGCELCRAPCRHLPGSLDVADLDLLCPPGHDLFKWAEEHLRAITDKPWPTLVPARQANNHCHWLFDGMCAVHGSSPYGCSFFDSHMSKEEADRRSVATTSARTKDAEENGLYYRVWQHLIAKKLTTRSGDRESLAIERSQIRRRTETYRSRTQGD